MVEVCKDLGEVIDRTKNAHHRIDETNKAVKEIKDQLDAVQISVNNIGTNMATADKRARRWRKWIIIIGAIAAVAFVGMFIQDNDIKKLVGEIAIKVGAGVASVL